MADLEERVSRLEMVIEQLITLAREYPIGRAVLRKLGLS